MSRPVHITKLPWEPVGVTFVGDPHTFKTKDMTDLLQSDLQEAKERGDMIVLWGDIAEWILPSDRKRYTSGKHNRQVDAIINEEVGRLADFYEPFVENIKIMKLGNHETAVIKNHHVDPMAMLVAELNRRGGDIFYGGYSMWWLVQMANYSENGTRTQGSNVKFWLHHGAGGSAPVTRGAIDRARIYDAIDADVYAIGHKHQSMHVTTKHERLDDYGNVKRFDRDFLLLAGYSGWEQSAPDNGYILNWSEQTFYGLESTGYKRMVLRPKKSKEGIRIEREIIGTSR